MAAAIAITVVLAGGARAQSEEAVQAAQELVQVLRPVNEQMLTDMIVRLKASFESGLSGADAETRQEISAELERLMRKYDDKLQAELPRIYAKHFDAAELRELKSFYDTPLGQKALLSLPAIMNDAMAEGMGPMQQELVASIKAIAARRAASK
jgi:uncharacterized protein